MLLLELFSGTGSVGKPWRAMGHDVISVDLDGRYAPEVCCDILRWSYCTCPVPDVIWASCPCEVYSVARTRARKPRNFELADSLVRKTWEIIVYFLRLNPDLLWFVENPASSLLWRRRVAESLGSPVCLDYCQYGSPGYRKRTKVATNAVWIPRPLCDPKTCGHCVDGKHLLTAQRGPSKAQGCADKCSLDTLHALPLELTEEILRVCKAAQWTHVGSVDCNELQ